MTIPTRTELHAEVDRQFRDQQPQAPERLDPDDPDQRGMVEAWLEIRDNVVNEWANTVFFEHFPEAGKLDPKDSGDDQLIEYWLDIRDQIRDDATPRWNWNDPDAARRLEAETRPATRLESVTPDSGGYVLTFDGAVDRDGIGLWLWPEGVPGGVELVALSSTALHLSGLSWDSYQSINSDVAGMIAQAGVITTGGDDPVAVHGSDGASTPAPNPDDIPEMDESELLEHFEHILHGTHVLADATEATGWFVKATRYHKLGEAMVAAGEGALGFAGAFAFMVFVTIQIVEAFGTGLRIQKQRGFCYGVMWEVTRQGDVTPEFEPWLDDSADDLREAWLDGVRQGRAAAQDPKHWNYAQLAIAHEMSKGFDNEFSAQADVLNIIWEKVHEENTVLEGSNLPWPSPGYWIYPTEAAKRAEEMLEGGDPGSH